mmetsp:Transcript_22091/g.66322  ORF Transcript_22091/g.66322 Transcript_22091/m.66322 type:complete len:206 (+) Transcript_22091:102-719(+)
MPEKASMARRPFSSSLSCISGSFAPPISSGSKPKSPGLRPEPSSISRIARKPMHSAARMKAPICVMAPRSTAMSCASMDATWCMSPGSLRPQSVATKPVTASMHTRPCLSSDSRSQSTGTQSESPSGSKPLSPTMPSSFCGRGRKGIAAERSLWYTTVALRAAGAAGANKAPAPTRDAARTRLRAIFNYGCPRYCILPAAGRERP